MDWNKHYNLAAPFRNAIDNEPWLSMLAWADSLEEEGSSYSHRFAKVLRWMVERRRFPRQKIVKGEVVYFWLWQNVHDDFDTDENEINSTWYKIRNGNSSHLLPCWDSPPRTPQKTASSCIMSACWFLSCSAESLK